MSISSCDGMANTDRAWAMIGIAMRWTLTFGLHTDSHCAGIEPGRREAIVQTWWSVHNLDTLLSSMTGRPTMLRSGDVTTPLPSDRAGDRHQEDSKFAMVMSFQDIQARLAIITQNILSNIYTERRAPRTRTQMQQSMSSLISNLDDWASHALPEHYSSVYSSPIHETHQFSLKNQYLHAKISITRPALRRIEHCTAFDRPNTHTLEAAETCIRTAQDVAALFPENIHLQLVYEIGPWWSIVSNSKPLTHHASTSQYRN
jgi:hypothetical protein